MKRQCFAGALMTVAAIFFVAPQLLFSQQGPPPLQPLLQQLLTGNLAQREEAFWTLKAIPHAASEPEVQKVLLQVLQREDGPTNPEPKTGDPAYGESYMEYIGWVNELVWRYAKLTNSEDHATLLAIAESPAALSSAEGDWLATRSALSVEDLATIEGLNQVLRSDALQGMAKFLNAARAGKREMTPARARQAKDALLAALGSPSAGDRYTAVFALESLKDPDDAHYLAALSGDPDHSVRGLARDGAAWLAKQPPVHHIAH